MIALPFRIADPAEIHAQEDPILAMTANAFEEDAPPLCGGGDERPSFQAHPDGRSDCCHCAVLQKAKKNEPRPGGQAFGPAVGAVFCFVSVFLFIRLQGESFVVFLKVESIRKRREGSWTI